MPKARHLPEERHQRAHHQGVAQTGEEVAGGGAVDTTELAGEQLIEAEKQRRAERQQHGWREQVAAGVDNDHNADKSANHRDPLAPGDALA
ncbi:hypothetical protein D3C85_1760240 [compost metagenome]